jgi:hypothetical protein
VGGWYWIGVLAGLGAAFGIAAAGIVLRWPLAALAGAVAGAAIGFGALGWPEGVAGAVGGVTGAFGASPIVNGALRRGGTRLAVAGIVFVAALGYAPLAFIPVLGYLQAAVPPVVGLRQRRREPERYAGLRTLARD